MSSAKKDPNKNTNEAQTGQSREGVREGKGSIYMYDLWDSQGQHTTRTIRLVAQDREKQSDTSMGREEHDQPVSEVSPGLGERDNETNEPSSRQVIWGRHGTTFRKYGTSVSNFKRDISGLGRISVKTGGLLQEKIKTGFRRRVHSVGVYIKNIHRLWTKNKGDSRMTKRVGFYLLIAVGSIMFWMSIIMIALRVYS